MVFSTLAELSLVSAVVDAQSIVLWIAVVVW
jgi:hypothetical protein